MDLNRPFSKDTQMIKKYVKRCSTSLTIRDTHIQTTMNYHFIPPRIAVTKKIITSVDKDVDKLEVPHTSYNKKWCSHFGNILAVPQTIKHTVT